MENTRGSTFLVFRFVLVVESRDVRGRDQKVL